MRMRAAERLARSGSDGRCAAASMRIRCGSHRRPDVMSSRGCFAHLRAVSCSAGPQPAGRHSQREFGYGRDISKYGPSPGARTSVLGACPALAGTATAVGRRSRLMFRANTMAVM